MSQHKIIKYLFSLTVPIILSSTGKYIVSGQHQPVQMLMSLQLLLLSEDHFLD